jgi:hypothetical protein
MGAAKGVGLVVVAVAFAMWFSGASMAASPKGKGASDDISDILDRISDPGGKDKPATKDKPAPKEKSNTKEKPAAKEKPTEFIDVEGPAGTEKVGPGGKTKGKARDPISAAVAKAFELPPNWQLDAKQLEEYNKLKSDLEPQLRKALEGLDEVRKGKDSAAKAKAGKELADVKKQVKDQKDQLLGKFYQEAMAQRAKQAEEYKKKMEEMKAKRGAGRR